MPFFSVVIPLYNKEKHLQKAIESVVNQSFQDFEVLVVNDGSTDGSIAVLEIINDPRIQVISQENLGVSKARNNGVRVAKGEYIAFLDADDWWEKDFLQEIKFLQENFQEAKIFGTRYFKVKKGKKNENINHEDVSYLGYFDYIKAYVFAWWMPLTSSSVVVSKIVFDEMKGFNEKLKFGEDFELWIRIILKYKLAYSNKVLANYNQNVDLDSRAVQRKLWPKQEHYIFGLDFLKDYAAQNENLKILLDGLKVRALHFYFRKGKYKIEIDDLLHSVDFKKQKLKYKFYYKYPFWMTESFFKFKILASKLKQKLK